MNYEGLFSDFYNVSVYVLGQLRSIFMSFYETSRFGFLFNMALMPIILFLAFDIVFSFILSVKFRRLIFFNVISSRSWNSLNLRSNQNRLKPTSASIRFSTSSSLTKKLKLKCKLYKNSSLKGKVFEKSYIDWRETLPKTLARNNVLLSSILNIVSNMNQFSGSRQSDDSTSENTETNSEE